MTDERLLSEFLQKRPGAIAEVREIVRGVVRARGHGIPPSDREDIVQESLLQIWRDATDPRLDRRSEFRGFVALVASRRCLDWWRRRYRRSRMSAGDGDGDARDRPDARLMARERAVLAQAVLSCLDDRCRELIRLRVIERRTYKEVGGLLGQTEGALRVQMCGCLKRARLILEELRWPDGPAPGGRSRPSWPLRRPAQGRPALHREVE